MKNVFISSCYFMFLFFSVTLILQKSHSKLSKNKPEIIPYINPIQDGLFRGYSRMGEAKKVPLPKICHTYPTMMKLGTVIPYPKKIQKIYESRDTPLEFCWHQDFFTGNQQILLYQEIQISIVFLCTISIYFNFSWVSIDFYKKHG